MSRNGIREVGDNSYAVPGIGSLIGKYVSRWGSKRKGRGRIRT